MLLALAAACGGAKKDADAPANTEDSASGGDGGTAHAGRAGRLDPLLRQARRRATTRRRSPRPCGGFDIPDLASVLSQAACEVDNPNPNEQKDVKDLLEIKVVPDSPRIAPGSTATVTVTFKNKGKGDLPLNFVVDPEPRFDFEVYTLKGARVDAPKGNAPALPPEVANAPAPEPKVARITLAQQGTAKLTPQVERGEVQVGLEGPREGRAARDAATRGSRPGRSRRASTSCASSRRSRTCSRASITR